MQNRPLKSEVLTNLNKKDKNQKLTDETIYFFPTFVNSKQLFK